MWARRAQSGCRCDRGEADPGADVGGAGRYRVRLEQSVGCSRPTTQSHAIVGPAEACLRRAKSSGPIRHVTLSRCASDRDGRCTAARLSDGRASAAETDADTAHSDWERHSTATSAPRTALAPAKPPPKPGPRGKPHLHRDRARPCHICNGTGVDPGLICACLRREWARPGHICKRDWAGVASVEHAILRRRCTRRHGRVDGPRALRGSLRAAAHCDHNCEYTANEWVRDHLGSFILA